MLRPYDRLRYTKKILSPQSTQRAQRKTIDFEFLSFSLLPFLGVLCAL